MKPIQIISQDLFDKVRSRFSNLEMGDETGAVTIDPGQAMFFDFDFVHEGSNLGRVSISLGELGSLKVYYSQGITETQDDHIKKEWFKFLKEMRFFAMRRLLRFDTRDITKTNLDKNDFQHLATIQGPKEAPMNTMNESRWNQKSTRKTSRAVKGRTEVIVRHASPVEETFPGARSQKKNIKAIFIQNEDGERFKYPFIHPAGAFAMAQHVDHGGVPHDPAGKAIIDMSEQIAQLQEFQRKIHRSTLHDDATGITDRAIGRLQELKSQVESLGKRQHYERWVAELNGVDNDGDMVLDDVTMEQYKQAFTQTSFQEELTGYFPLLHKIMRETNKVDLEDYVGEAFDVPGPSGQMGQSAVQEGTPDGEHSFETTIEPPDSETDKGDDFDYDSLPSEIPVEVTYNIDSDSDWSHSGGRDYENVSNYAQIESIYELSAPGGERVKDLSNAQLSDWSRSHIEELANKHIQQMHRNRSTPENQFEAWADATEQGSLTDDQITQLKQALSDLPVDNDVPTLELGPDGQTAIQFFSDFGLDDDDLSQKFVDALNVDPSTNAVDVFKKWAQDNYEQLAVALGMSKDQQQPTDENEEQGGMPNKTMPTREAVIKEVAKLVKSRFNEDNLELGAFNGAPNIALDVKKKCAEMFGDDVGEQAESLALEFMEKLSRQREAKNRNTEDDGLTRLKELLNTVKSKVEGIGDQGNSVTNFNNNIMPAETVAEGMSRILKLSGLSK